MLQQINMALDTMWRGVKSIVESAFVAPIACFALAQAIFLALFVNFHVSLWSGALAPLLRVLGGGAAVHYPQLYIVLPNVFNTANLVLGATVGAYLWGVAVFAIAGRNGHGNEGSPWHAAAVRFPQLFLAQLPVVIAALAVFFLPGLILGDADLSGMPKRALLYGPIVLGVIAESVFLFAPMGVVIEDRNPLSAIARSVEIWSRNPLATLILVGVTTALHLPVTWALMRTPSIVTRFSPETVLVVMGGDVVLGVVTNLVLVVSGTFVFLHALRREAS